MLILAPMPVGAKALTPLARAMLADVSAALASTTAATSTPPTPVPAPPAPTPAPIAAAVTTSAPAASNLSDSEIIALTQPAVVRVVAHFEGTSTPPRFAVNFASSTWSMSQATSTPIPYDDYLSGSGFVIDPSGYIITNSHVVSSAEIRMQMAASVVESTMLSSLAALTPAQQKKLGTNITDPTIIEKLTTDGLTYVLDNFPPLNPPTVAVLKPTVGLPATTTSAYLLQIDSALAGEKQQADSAMQQGVAGIITVVNDNFLNDEKDVAILKVDEKNLPAITLGDSSAVHEGDSVHLFGFPASADVNGLTDPPTFTTGTVSALKDSTQHTFQYIQTDASVSPGSSGSPVIDSTGAAIGIVTLQSAGTSGDSFAFALPIKLAEDVLAAQSITPATTGYASHFLAGLSLQAASHCKAALVEFQAAASTNNVFGDVTTYVQPHIDACNALIAAGNSVDSTWDQIRIWAKQVGIIFWIAIGVGIVLLIALIIGIFLLMHRLHKEERVLKDLETQAGSPQPKPQPQPQPAAHLPPAGVVAPAQIPVQPKIQPMPAAQFNPQPLPPVQQPVMPAQPQPVRPQVAAAAAAAVATSASAPVKPTTQPPVSTNPAAASYIAQCRKTGLTEVQIRAAMISAGWKEADVDREMAAIPSAAQH